MTFAEALSKLMIKYQKEHSITGECISNSKYFFDNIKRQMPNSKVECICVIAHYKHKTLEEFTACIHLVVMVDGLLYDPSHDIFTATAVKYIKNLHDFRKYVPDHELSRDEIQMVVDLTRFANKINNGTPILVAREHYDGQADYIHAVLNMAVGLQRSSTGGTPDESDLQHNEEILRKAKPGSLATLSSLKQTRLITQTIIA
jgi:hypothetical protein